MFIDTNIIKTLNKDVHKQPIHIYIIIHRHRTIHYKSRHSRLPTNISNFDKLRLRLKNFDFGKNANKNYHRGKTFVIFIPLVMRVSRCPFETGTSSPLLFCPPSFSNKLVGNGRPDFVFPGTRLPSTRLEPM